MASRNSPAPGAESPQDSHFPNAQLSPSGPPSIISSRMTDIASEDGDTYPPTATNRTQTNRHSLQSMSASRPGTGSAGVSTRSPWAQSPPSRRGPPGQRGSITGLQNLASGSSRPLSSSTSRTHVPSVTSHAFFRPLSSQRLQAQRGGSRPPTLNQQRASEDFGSSDAPPVPSIISDQTAAKPEPGLDDSGPPPPSRGTELSLPETYVRTTANTTPTQDAHDHHATTRSLASSVRPLQNNPANARGLSVNTDTSYRNQHLPTPAKSPHSFRSSFLIPSRAGDIAPHSPNRSSQGHEKLSSGATSPNVRQSDATLPAPIKHNPRLHKEKNYQYFPGNTRFWLSGRWQNARDRPVNIATGFLVVLPAVLFFIFSAPWLWHNISPAIPIVFAYIFFICFSSFVHASVSDPGILPRNLHRFPPPQPTEDPLTLAPPTTAWLLIKSFTSASSAMEVPVKYCKTCNIWRPPRAHHCRICDNCIETHDHHCVWLNNCVGRRNYRYFFTFVSSATLMGLYALGASLAQLIVFSNREGVSFGHAIDHDRVVFALVVYSAIAIPYPLALMTYHVFLMGRGETTRELLNGRKFVKSERHRPFNLGSLVKNYMAVLCRPRPPTYVEVKRRHDEGDQRFAERRTKGGYAAEEAGVEMRKLGEGLPGLETRPDSGAAV